MNGSINLSPFCPYTADRALYPVWGFSLLRAAFLLVLAAGTMMTSNVGAEEEENDLVEADVVVVGAGSAGIPAAVQSARAGARTILIESGFQAGGQATTGSVNFPGIFHAWGKQVISGIGWEWVSRTVELSGGVLPDFTESVGNRHWVHQINVNIPVYVAMAEELCEEANVELRYFEAPSSVEKKTDSPFHWKVTTSAQGKARVILCKQLIDCSGNATLVDLCGGTRIREAERAPGTFNYHIEHQIDLKTVDQGKIRAQYEEALRNGLIRPGDARGGIIDFLGDSRRNYVYDADSSTAESRTRTDREGRRAMLRMFRFVKTLPGGENAVIDYMSPEVGVRETWRAVGRYQITVDDYRAGRRWDDSLAYAYYPVDLHKKNGVLPVQLEEGVVPTIPLRALLVKDVENLLVAGRCLSADQLACSGLRVQASCMASGQAAGAAAALAVFHETSPDRVDLEEIKDLLRKSGAIVP